MPKILPHDALKKRYKNSLNNHYQKTNIMAKTAEQDSTKQFDLIKTMKQINLNYKKLYETNTHDIQIKPDFYNFLTGRFVCGECGEKYWLFHFIHSTINK